MLTRTLLASLVAAGFAGASQAAVVTLSAMDIHGGDTTTTSFSNADVTLTPFAGGVNVTFNDNADRLGTDQAGTQNANAFADVSGDGSDGETLVMDFAANAGLTGLSWDFSRGDVTISGFLSDPGASLSGAVSASPAPTFSAGVLTFELEGADFGGPDGFLTLANASASAGQTLTLAITDVNQAGPQIAVTSISYEDAVPEPGSLALLGLGGLLIARRRRG